MNRPKAPSARCTTEPPVDRASSPSYNSTWVARRFGTLPPPCPNWTMALGSSGAVTDDAARSPVFEAPSHDVDTVGEQGGRQRIPGVASVPSTVEREYQALVTVYSTARRQAPRLSGHLGCAFVRWIARHLAHPVDLKYLVAHGVAENVEVPSATGRVDPHLPVRAPGIRPQVKIVAPFAVGQRAGVGGARDMRLSGVAELLLAPALRRNRDNGCGTSNGRRPRRRVRRSARRWRSGRAEKGDASGCGRSLARVSANT